MWCSVYSNKEWGIHESCQLSNLRLLSGNLSFSNPTSVSDLRSKTEIKIHKKSQNWVFTTTYFERCKSTKNGHVIFKSSRSLVFLVTFTKAYFWQVCSHVLYAFWIRFVFMNLKLTQQSTIGGKSQSGHS